jgi:hypothetical protein
MDKLLVQFTDPTYLRTIHDGLLTGTVHKDNASALPIGLVGMYEEALPPAGNIKERTKFLEFFAVWALLKKEVSAEFVVPLLEGWTEQEVLDYIAQYSKWFNSPVSGKYVLYHERLRGFILTRITNIVNLNIRLLKKLLEQAELNTAPQNEFTTYLEAYYGDHVAVAAYFRTDEDYWYCQLGLLDSKIEESKWNVVISDRIRWNSLAGTLAAIEVDEPFLENIILSQDRILNTPVDVDYFIRAILQENYGPLDDYCLYINNEVEKGVFVIVLINRLRSLIDQHPVYGKSNKTIINSQQIENILNELIKRLNTSIQTGVWISAENYLHHLNLYLSSISLDHDILIDSIITPEPDGDMLFDLIENGPIKIDDLNMYSSEFVESYIENKEWLNKRVFGTLNEIVSEAVEPGYTGKIEDIIKVKDAIQNLSTDNQLIEIKLIELLIQIKDMISLTGDSDFNYTFNQNVNYIIRDCIIFSSSASEQNWLICYVNPIIYHDTVMYYQLIRNVSQAKSIRKDFLFNNRWSSRDLFLAAANSAVQLLYAKGKKVIANNLQNETMEYYMNYQLTDMDTIRITNQLQCDSLKPKAVKEIEYSFSKMDFNHMPTLAYLLCQKYSFLDLAAFLWYDGTHLSNVSENKHWAQEIVKGVVLKLGAVKSYDYFIAGIDQYVSVMGSYENDAYDRESNRPAGNIWKLEWWVIGNFVLEYEDYMNQYSLDKIFDYGAIKEYDSEEFFDSDKYYDDIDMIFNKYGYDPEINLYAAIHLWKDEKCAVRNQNGCDRLFNYFTKPTQTLLGVNYYLNNRVAINNVASAISSKRKS